MKGAISVAVASTGASLLLHGLLLWFGRSDMPAPLGRPNDERKILFTLVEPTPVAEPHPDQGTAKVIEPEARVSARPHRPVASPPAPPNVTGANQPHADAPTAPKGEASTKPAPLTPRPLLDLRAGRATPSTRILAGASPLPFQPRAEQLLAALDPPSPQIERWLREGVTAPGSVPEQLVEELRPLVNSLELAWNSTSREHLRSNRITTLGEVLNVFGMRAPEWRKQYERYLALTQGARDAAVDVLEARGATSAISDTVDVLAQLDHDESGAVTRVTIIESSGDQAFDEWLKAVVTRIGIRGSPRVLASVIRFRASTEVVIPVCGAAQQSSASQDITTRVARHEPSGARSPSTTSTASKHRLVAGTAQPLRLKRPFPDSSSPSEAQKGVVQHDLTKGCC